MRNALLTLSTLLGSFVLALPGKCEAAEPPKVARLPSPQAEARTQVLIQGEFLEISRTEMAARGFDLGRHDEMVRQILEDQSGIEAADNSVDQAAVRKRLDEFRSSLDALKKARIAKVSGEPTIATVPGRPIHFRFGKNLEDTPGPTKFLGNELHCNVELRPAGRILLDWKVNTDGAESTGKSLLNLHQFCVGRVQVAKTHQGAHTKTSDEVSEEVEYIFLLTPEVVTAMGHAPVVPSLPKKQGREIQLRTEVWEVLWTHLEPLGLDYTTPSGGSLPCIDMLGPNAPPDAIAPFLKKLEDNRYAHCIALHELTLSDGSSGRVKAGSESLTSALYRDEKLRPEAAFLGTEGTYEVDMKEDHTVAVEFKLALNQLHDVIKTAAGEIVRPRVSKREITSGLNLKLGEPATLNLKYKRKKSAVRNNADNEAEQKPATEVEEIVLLIVLRAELVNANTARLPTTSRTQK